MSNIKNLKFNFDISSYRLLGRELITDRITALFEIVKNSYDANSENVSVKFFDVNTLSNKSRIVIEDDGSGMDLFDLENKWMVIGTMSKRETRRSPAPYNRRVVGKKGVGRFAVDKLGAKVILKTTMKGSTIRHCLETDWTKYEQIESKQLQLSFDDSKFQYFTDIENKYWEETVEKKTHGTSIEIYNITDPWVEKDIRKATTELSKLISPIETFDYPFNIYVSSNEYKELNDVLVQNNSIGFATLEVEIDFDLRRKKQQRLFFNEQTNNLDIIESDYDDDSMGPVKMRLFYFDQNDKRKFNKSYSGAIIDGVKIYRDGLITTPFAEYALERDKERDILGIDKRRYSGFFDKISSRDLLGFIEITDKNNPLILESTNRQDFVDNKQYRELRTFIIDQIKELEKKISAQKTEEREETKSKLKIAHNDLQKTSAIIRAIRKIATPEVKEKLTQVTSNVREIEVQIKRGISDYNELEKEQIKQRNLFLSLMSLQDYASEISHVVRTSISNISDSAKFFTVYYPDEKYNNHYLKHADHIGVEMNKLSSAIDFMLSYAKSNVGFTEIDLRATISDLFNKTYRDRFIKNDIHYTVEMKDSFVFTHNLKFFEDIFENLIGNSLKALKSIKGKKHIKCSGNLNGDMYEIYFSDNGVGVPKRIQNKIFNIYFTTTESEGGAGMGLYIVKTRINAMKGSVELIENEFKPTGTTFKICLPLKVIKDEI
ncbi:sensor histidine kinase [uncultured Lacinutrix sp.]|uniref:ATP-binding protein n=1 Tax=uncultured Lacinutrix sp. TaxID=574032 RepID=UPI002601B02F|nr:sensor histidine kinase [uncultured Lacinutrix sp.]